MQGIWFFVIYLAACAAWDGRTRRIPNGLAVLGLAAGLLAAGGRGGPEIAAAAGRGMSAVAIGLFLYRFRVIGAGDVKMAAVIVVWLGFAAGGAGILAGLCLGALWSLGRLLRRGILGKRFGYLVHYVSRFLATGQAPAYYDRERDGDEAVIPLGVCLAVGTGVVMMVGGR